MQKLPRHLHRLFSEFTTSFFFFVKDSLLTGQCCWETMLLDMATINKTRSSYARVKMRVDLSSHFPKQVNMKILYGGTKAIRMKYDFLPKYCTKCKLHGYANDTRRVLHPELVLRQVIRKLQ